MKFIFHPTNKKRRAQTHELSRVLVSFSLSFAAYLDRLDNIPPVPFGSAAFFSAVGVDVAINPKVH